MNKHGIDLSTQILAECLTYEEARVEGLKYSKLWNVVESKEFANLVPEDGQGGAEVSKLRKTNGSRFGYEQSPNRLIGDLNPSKRADVREKISKRLKGRSITWGDKISKSKKGKPTWNKGKHNPHASTNHMNIKLTCPHCRQEGGKGAMIRWHFDNCKSIASS